MKKLLAFLALVAPIMVSCGDHGADSVNKDPGSHEVALNTELLDLSEDASRRNSEPGQHEWWNFFAQDEQSGLGVSTIFLNGNMFDVDYRIALEHYRIDPELHPAPDPADYPLLQLNVILSGRKLFTSIKLPPQTTTEFASERPYGRVGESWFEGLEEEGKHHWRVHIDSPDMFNWLRLEADIEYRDASRAFTVSRGGLFAPIPDGEASGIHFHVASPVATGRVRITDRFERVVLDETISGGGHADHVFGKFYSDLVRSYYFGRLDLGSSGELFYFYHFPRDPGVAPYGWLMRTAVNGGAPRARAITEVLESRPARGAAGLAYYEVIEITLAGGGTIRTYMERTAASEDWPFQITGVGHFDVEIPGDIRVQEALGIAEFGYFDGLDDPLFRFLSSLLRLFPWLP